MVETMKKYLILAFSLLIASSIFASTLSKEIVEKVKEATVFILIESANNTSITNPTGRGTCSGFVINEQRYIVTNYHCVHNSTQLMLAFYDRDDWNMYDVKIIGIDPLADVAVIQIPKRKKPLPYLNWSTEEPWDGMDVFAVGHPFGMVWTITKGIISNNKRIVRSPYVRYVQTDTAINQGNSGGPLVNTAGNVIGINSLIISPQTVKVHAGVALALRNDDAKEIVDVLIKGEEFIRAIIGVSLVNLNPLNRNSIVNLPDVKEAGITIPNTFGCVVAPSTDIPEGLEKFDTIVGVDGHAINRQEHITDIIRTKNPGDTVDLLIIRDRVYKNVTVTLKKLEITGDQLFNKKGQPTVPQPPNPEKPNDETQKESETPKEEKPNEEPKTDNETTK
jgi:S1-C subfamily serine protease